MSKQSSYLKFIKSKIKRLKTLISYSHNELRKDIKSDESMVTFLQETIFKIKTTRSNFEKRLFYKKFLAEKRTSLPLQTNHINLINHNKNPVKIISVASPKLSQKGMKIKPEEESLNVLSENGIFSQNSDDDEIPEENIIELRNYLKEVTRKRKSESKRNNKSKKFPVREKVKGKVNQSWDKKKKILRKSGKKKRMKMNKTKAKLFRHSFQDQKRKPLLMFKKPPRASLVEKRRTSFFKEPGNQGERTSLSFINSNSEIHDFGDRAKKNQFGELKKILKQKATLRKLEREDKGFLTERRKTSITEDEDMLTERYDINGTPDFFNEDISRIPKRGSEIPDAFQIDDLSRKNRDNSFVLRRRKQLESICRKIDKLSHNNIS